MEFSATFIVFKGKSKTIDQPPPSEPPLPASTESSAVLPAQGAAVPTSTLASVESSNKAVVEAAAKATTTAATGALADILDLDFGAVQNNEVNELNRQYILDHQTAALRPLLRPSVESPTAVLTNPNPSLPATLPSSHPGTIPSSNSSTASSSGSRRNSSLRKQALPPPQQANELHEKSSAVSLSSNVVGGESSSSNPAVLRDTKIEIAGKLDLNPF